MAAMQVFQPRRDEQEIRQPIHIPHDNGVHFHLARQRHDAPLGPACHGAGEVQGSAALRAAGQDELAQRLQLRLEAVDPFFQLAHLVFREGGLGAALGLHPGARIGQLGADREQVALDGQQARAQVVILAHEGQGEAQYGVQFVHVAVGRHPRGVFRHPGAVEQSGLACVTRARVYFHASFPPLDGGAAMSATASAGSSASRCSCARFR